MTKVKKQIVQRLYKGVEPSKDDMEATIEIIMEGWIKPIQSFDIVFEEYSFAPLNDCGIHILKFKYDQGHPHRLHIDKIRGESCEYLATRSGMVKLTDILERDDDGQPEAKYTMFFGTLLIYLPYFS